MLSACFLHASCVLPSILLLNVTVVYQTHYFGRKLTLFCQFFQEARRKHTCVLPACFLKKLAKQCEFPSNLALNQGFWYTVTCSSSIVGSTQEACRKHTSLPIKAESGTHTKKATFQEAHMGASCVLPSVASLTGRSVSIQRPKSSFDAALPKKIQTLITFLHF